MGKLIKTGGAAIIFFIILLQILAFPMPLPEAIRLQADVWAAPYSVSDFKKDEFDCGNMGPLLCDWLALKGWDISIVMGGPPGGIGHVWLEEKNSGKYIEPTLKTVFLPKFFFFTWTQLHYRTNLRVQKRVFNSSTDYVLKNADILENREIDYYFYIDYPTLAAKAAKS